MKHNLPIDQLNKAFDNRSRLGIMTLLISKEWTDFTELKEKLNLTDGNLSTHLKHLEEMKYLEVRKSFVGRKPNSSYRITEAGNDAFMQHLKALEEIIKLRK